MAIRSMNKLPKRRVTVDEILHCDDITELLQDLYEKRHEIDQFLLIYTDNEGVPHNYWQGTKERIIYAMEAAKLMILDGKTDADESEEAL